MNQSRRNVLAFLGSIAALTCIPCGELAAETWQPGYEHVATPLAIKAAAEALIQRVIPSAASQFHVELIDREQGQDIFEVESSHEKIVLRGNNGVSIASALNHYLKYFCHRQMTWWDDVQPLHGPLPSVPEKIRAVSVFQYRAYLNYCTFSYTSAWWDWKRWQREIDWMAMHGINMPLAITGQEATWQATLRKFKMNDDEIRQFFCGPAFFAWQWMANLEGWGGPLPQSWIDSHLALGQQILQRERELGMTPILQGFTGFVPRAIKDKFPEARIQIKPKWCNVFEGTAQLDPLDPLFRRMGTAFLEEQQKLFGTDHFYAADPFHESSPPSSAPEYLPAVAKEILSTMQADDPQAKITMQTWSLRKPLVVNIPKDKIVLLALTGTGWHKTDGFWEHPWLAGVIHNYGGRIFMAGSLEKVLGNALTSKTTQGAGDVVGTGMFPEAIEQNPVFYDAASEIAWMQKMPDTATWLHTEITARYGRDLPVAQDAWKVLLKSLYANGAEEGSVESPVCSRPALFLDRAAPNADFHRHYDPELVWEAWDTLQSASKQLVQSDAYKYDLVDLARQALADLSIPLHNDISVAYAKEDHAALLAASARFLELAKDMDMLLGTRKECLLGVWLSTAKKWATNEDERRQYECNARLQVTVWGPRAPDAFLFDYSNRQWSGLIGEYYIPRWEQFLNYLASQSSGTERFTGSGIKLSYKRPADEANAFYQELSRWEQKWCDRTDEYATAPQGDSIQISSQLLAKWNPVRKVAYQHYDLRTLDAVNATGNVSI